MTKLTARDVIAAYRLLLGRVPESETIIRNYVEHATFETLRESILGSVEFARQVVADPHFLNVKPYVLGTTHAMRLATRQMEHLASLALPLWGKNVLCPNVGPGLIPTFFTDRQCKVVIATSDANLAEEKQQIFKTLARNGLTRDLEVRPLDVCGDVEQEDKDRWQVIASYDTILRRDNIRRRIKNMCRRCSDILILDTRAAFGNEDEVFIYRTGADGAGASIAVPTRNWFWLRLTEELPHVYLSRTQPCHEDYPLAWTVAGQGAPFGRVVFVASRTPLDEGRFSAVMLDEHQMHV